MRFSILVLSSMLVLSLSRVEAKQNSYVPPVQGLLAQLESSNFSFISKGARSKIRDLLADLDDHHISALKRKIEGKDQTSEVLKADAIGYLSKSLPESEKIIIYILKRQELLLQQYFKSGETGHSDLVTDNPKKRIRKESERVFYNYGDRFYTELISTIENISRYQVVLNNKCLKTADLDIALDVEADNVENFVIHELQILTKNAEILDEYIN